MRKITVILFFLMLGIWTICAFYTNRICQDRYQEVTVSDGRLKLDGLNYQIENAKIYDVEKYLSLNPALYEYMDDYTGASRYGCHFIIAADMMVTNLTRSDIDLNQKPSVQYIQSGAWSNGLSITCAIISPIYSEENQGILKPGETAKVVIETDIYEDYIESMDIADLEKRVFTAVLSVEENGKVTNYHLQFSPAGYESADQKDIEQYKNALDVAAKKEKDFMEDPLEKEEVPANTTAHITQMGCEYIKNGFGYTVTKAQISEDIAKLDVDHNPDHWQSGEIDSPQDGEHFIYGYVEMEVHNYSSTEKRILSREDTIFRMILCGKGENAIGTDYMPYHVLLSETEEEAAKHDYNELYIDGNCSVQLGLCYCIPVGNTTLSSLQLEPILSILADTGEDDDYIDRVPIIQLDNMEVR